MNFVNELRSRTAAVSSRLFGAEISQSLITINLTNAEYTGDYTVVVFPLVKFSKRKPDETAQLLGEALLQELTQIRSFEVVKGFLNLQMTDEFWVATLRTIATTPNYGTRPPTGEKVVLEYCGPNTNKPLHIGHIRNMLLGFSMAEILKATGSEVVKVNIYNDRGIAISKSMVAWKRYAQGASPQSSGIKGDHFVGDWYVRYNAELKNEIDALPNAPAEKEAAEKLTSLHREAQELVVKWEQGDADTIALWKKMNGWVYEGFRETFALLGVDFQKDYYESETYLLGKNIIDEGLKKGVFYKRADGAVCIDLTADGLDEKVLLRSDGTSVYITQDLGTAQLRYDDFGMQRMIYVVADEQNYHFKVLKLALQKLGKSFAAGIHHLSYALVESPTGRFKSREGKTADADDLIAEVLRIAEEKTRELGKIEGFSDEEAQKLYRTIGLGALKFFILRVNPFRKIIFNPEESIDFHGHTGPFVQYTHARICAVLRKAGGVSAAAAPPHTLTDTERKLMLQLSEFPNTVMAAATNYDPSEIANYVYALAKAYNHFYATHSILAAATDAEKNMRLLLSEQCATVIRSGMKLLGMDVPERM